MWIARPVVQRKVRTDGNQLADGIRVDVPDRSRSYRRRR